MSQSTPLGWLETARAHALQEMRRTAREGRKLLQTLDHELPETAAALRLSGYELSDCMEEVSLLR